MNMQPSDGIHLPLTPINHRRFVVALSRRFCFVQQPTEVLWSAAKLWVGISGTLLGGKVRRNGKQNYGLVTRWFPTFYDLGMIVSIWQNILVIDIQLHIIYTYHIYIQALYIVHICSLHILGVGLRENFQLQVLRGPWCPRRRFPWSSSKELSDFWSHGPWQLWFPVIWPTAKKYTYKNKCSY